MGSKELSKYLYVKLIFMIQKNILYSRAIKLYLPYPLYFHFSNFYIIFLLLWIQAYCVSFKSWVTNAASELYVDLGRQQCCS